MAGTIVADTIQDGAGNSTSMDNAIYGSAKAWVTMGTANTILASYNVSSVTLGSTTRTVNFTNAMSNANYAYTGSGCDTSNGLRIYTASSGGTKTTTQIVLNNVYANNSVTNPSGESFQFAVFGNQ